MLEAARQYLSNPSHCFGHATGDRVKFWPVVSSEPQLAILAAVMSDVETPRRQKGYALGAYGTDPSINASLV